MNAERKRLKRLQRLSRVREIAKQAAAREAADAESTLAKLEALADRTRGLAAEYAARGQAPDGAALRQIGAFTTGLLTIHDSTRGDAERARVVADGKLEELGRAERRRALVEERAIATRRALARRPESPALGARTGTAKASGTPLE
jgi:hypothetical protein